MGKLLVIYSLDIYLLLICDIPINTRYPLYTHYNHYNHYHKDGDIAINVGKTML